MITLINSLSVIKNIYHVNNLKIIKIMNQLKLTRVNLFLIYLKHNILKNWRKIIQINYIISINLYIIRILRKIRSLA